DRGQAVLPMKRAYLFILASFVWLIGGGIAIAALLDPKPGEGLPDAVFWGIFAVFAILFLIGTALWSKAIGYHPIVGVILGWSGPLGLLLLAFLPNRSRPPEDRPASRPTAAV